MVGPSPHRRLILSAYRAALKDAAFLDKTPLAAAFFGAVPMYHWDEVECAWAQVSASPSPVQAAVSELCNGPTTHVPAANRDTFTQFVQDKFRGTQWNSAAFFACSRRAALARSIHTRCAPALPPPAVPTTATPTPGPTLTLERMDMQDVDELVYHGCHDADVPPEWCLRGFLLASHPSQLDNNVQTAVLVQSPSTVCEDDTADPGVVEGYVWSEEATTTVAYTLRKLQGQIKRKRADLRSILEAVGDLPLHSGGPCPSEPVVIHTSAVVASEVAAGLGQPMVLAPDLFITPLRDILQLCSVKTVQGHLTANQCRCMVNCVQWARAQLRGEIASNQWIPAAMTRVGVASSLRALATAGDALREQWSPDSPQHQGILPETDEEGAMWDSYAAWRLCVSGLPDIADYGRMQKLSATLSEDLSSALSDGWEDDMGALVEDEEPCAVEVPAAGRPLWAAKGDAPMPAE